MSKETVFVINLENIYDFNNKGGISGIYTLSGSCGIFDGYENDTEKTECGFSVKRNEYRIDATIEKTGDVFLRTDTFECVGKEDIQIKNYSYRFCFVGGEYDIYTQSSNWQNESDGM